MQCVLKVSQNKRDLWLLLCWPVYTYADYYKGWKIQAECPEESHYATHRVSCFPGYRARPSDFEWHHQECHLDNDKMQHISCLLQANRERYDYFIASYLRSRRYTYKEVSDRQVHYEILYPGFGLSFFYYGQHGNISNGRYHH